MNRTTALLVFLTAAAHADNAASTAARTWREAHEQAILAEFVDLLSIPNIASDTPNIRLNAAAFVNLL